MSQTDAHTAVQPILSQYGIKPHYIERIGSAYKIYSKQGTFALKEASPYKGMNFVRNIHLLFQKGYNRIIPIYPTPDGRYAVLHQNKLFYLMPWVGNEHTEDRNSKQKQLFRELARLHTLSSKEVELTDEDATNHYEETKAGWEKESLMLDEMIEACEQKWYMSPFELMICTYYHNIKQALQFALRKLDDWYDKVKDSKKMRMVIVHGKVAPDHFLLDQRGYGYFINFEESRYASPHHDLLPFVARACQGLPRQNEDMVEWIYTYMNHFALREAEIDLLISYLAYPHPIIQILEKYFKSTSRFNQYKAVRELQQNFWSLKNSEYIVMRLNEIEKQKKQAKEGAQEEG